MHPWFGIGHLERRAKWNEMREWLKANRHLRIKRGTARADGKRFLGYGLGYKNGENWTAPDAFERRADHARKAQRQLRKSTEYKAKYNEYIRSRYQNKEHRLAKSRERCREHRKNKPWLVAARTRRRYALKKSRIHPDLDRKHERGLFMLAAELTRRTGIEHQVDHIIPLCRGGWHHQANLQVLPITANLAKGTDPFWESDLYLTWRDVPTHLWPSELSAEYNARILRVA